MTTYLFRRILLFIPTLIIISLLAFVITANAPGDPVERLLTIAQSGEVMNKSSQSLQEQKKYWTHRLGLDLPVFYFSLVPLSFPDTLYRISNKDERNAMQQLLVHHPNWQLVEIYHRSLLSLNAANEIRPDSSMLLQYNINTITESENQSRFVVLSLLSTADASVIHSKLDELKDLYAQFPFFHAQQKLLHETSTAYQALTTISSTWKNYIPAIHFYPNNQYHRWLFGDGNWLTGKGSTFSKGLLRGDLGMSYTTKMAVSETIRSRIGWSFFFTLISVILAYLISIPIGIRSATRKGSTFDQASSVVLFILYSMPGFWLATLLLMIFANPDVLHWFPASGVKPVTGYPEGAGLAEKIKVSLPYLILPIIAYTYSSFAFLSRLTRISMVEALQQDYIRTARAKGLGENAVIYRHAFRNALLPLITVFANLFPVVIGGSVLLETIFSIPGMGLETYNAIQTQNYPVIVGVMTLTGVMTLIGYLIADLLYSIADPRISLSKKN